MHDGVDISTYIHGERRLPVASDRATLVVAAFVGWLAGMLAPIGAAAWWTIDAASQARSPLDVVIGHDATSPLPIAGGQWYLAQWLPAHVHAFVYERWGIAGSSVTAGLLGASLAVGLVMLAARSASTAATVIAAVVLAPVAYVNLTLGGQLWATAIFAAILLSLWMGRWLACPPLLVVWANVHGSALVGVAACAIAVVGALSPEGVPLTFASRWRRAAWIGACGIATWITPLGTQLADYLRRVGSIPHRAELTGSWEHPSPHSPTTWLLVVAAGLSALWAWEDVSRRRFVVPVAAFAAATALAQRNGAFAAFALAPYVGAAIDSLIPVGMWRRMGRAVTVGTVIALGIAVVAYRPGSARQQRRAFGEVPLTLERRVPKRATVFAHPAVASHLRLARAVTVVVDPRYERYRHDAIDAYVDISRGNAGRLWAFACARGDGARRLFPGWPHDRPGPSIVLVSRDFQRRLVERIERGPAEWSMLGSQGRYVVAAPRCVR